jgi:hypothetical protein
MTNVFQKNRSKMSKRCWRNQDLNYFLKKIQFSLLTKLKLRMTKSKEWSTQ